MFFVYIFNIYLLFVLNISSWWFHIFFMFTPIPGEMIQFDNHIFQMGGKKKHQLDSISFKTKGDIYSQFFCLRQLSITPEHPFFQDFSPVCVFFVVTRYDVTIAKKHPHAVPWQREKFRGLGQKCRKSLRV